MYSTRQMCCQRIWIVSLLMSSKYGWTYSACCLHFSKTKTENLSTSIWRTCARRKKNENVNKKRLTIAIMMKMSNRLHTYTSWNFCSWCYNVAVNTTTTTTYLMYILWGQVYFEMHASCSPSRSENKRVELINYTYQWPKIVCICMCVWVHVKATANKTINNKV